MCRRCGFLFHRDPADDAPWTGAPWTGTDAQDYGPAQGNPDWSRVAPAATTTVDALVGGPRWGSGAGTVVTYSFVGAGSQFATVNYGTAATGGAPWDPGYRGLTTAERAAVRDALAAWAAVADVRFVEVADDSTTVGDLRFGVTGHEMEGASAYAYFPGPSPIAGDVWFRPSTLTGRDLSPGSFAFMVMLHEIGHALGLKHPFDAGSGNGAVLSADLDQSPWTVMAYNTSPGFQGDLSVDVSTPMGLDVAAIQWIYGAAAGTRTGDDAYVFDGARAAWLTLWDAGGTDTIRWTGAGAAAIDLTPGAWSQLGPAITDGRTTVTRTVHIARGVTIENATGGAAADTLVGNAVANRLDGGAGDDMLTGGAGADVLDGGTGRDTAVFAGLRAAYAVTVAADGTIRVANAAEGDDTLLGIEVLRFADATVLATELAPAVAATAVSPLGTALANQLFTVYFGRGVSAAWRDATAEVAAVGGISPSLQQAAFALAVQDGAFAAGDALTTVVDRTFRNIFGTSASAFEQTAWAATVEAGAVTREGLPWAMFVSYLGATNVPASYQVPAQSRLIAVDAFTAAVTGTAAVAAVGGPGAAGATAARVWLLPITGQADAAAKVASASTDVAGIVASTGRQGWSDLAPLI